jgi:hypothetical protein
VWRWHFRIEAWGPVERPPSARHGSPAPTAVGLELEKAISRVTDAGFVAVVFQPRRSVEDLTLSRQEPNPGTPVTGFRKIALWLDETELGDRKTRTHA